MEKTLVTILGALIITAFTACSTQAQVPSPTPSPMIDLTRPGAAKRAVDELCTKAGDVDIVRVKITDKAARLTYVDDWLRPVSLKWENGIITEVDEGTDTVVSSSFDPKDFNIGDVGQMFRQAGRIAGSYEHQELQITEYSDAKILMTVSTNPESMTVFFRPDASVIAPLNYLVPEGIHAGLAEAIDKAPLILGAKISAAELWVDLKAGPAHIERRIRKNGVPAYHTQRSQQTDNEEFDPSLIDPQAILTKVQHMATVSPAHEMPDWTVSIKKPLDSKVELRYEVDGKVLITDLEGNEI